MKWNNVKNSLPEIGVPVLCLKKSMDYCIGSYLGAKYSDEYSAFKHSEKDMAFGVSHWMSLPKPPDIN